MKKEKFILILIILAIIIVGSFLRFNKYFSTKQIESNATNIQTPEIQREKEAESNKLPDQQSNNQPPKISKNIKENVPFVIQAPFGNWKNPVFQNGCEEASIIMAMGWTKGAQSISETAAEKQILDIVDFENKKFGYNADTDVFDVAKILQQYFNYQKISIKEAISLSNIQEELQKGNLILVPVFGQKLKNPFFTAPGPITHMLVIISYDSATEEFITNDPGTKRGKDYRYNENILFDAIWQYPSGQEIPPAPTGILKKSMVIVEK